jgi:hypothetical protein
MFRFKKAIAGEVDYDTQGYIYFVSRMYKKLPAGRQKKILNLCMRAGGEHYQALFAFVTTGEGAVAVCMKYYISQSTLERMVRRYYVAFSKTL